MVSDLEVASISAGDDDDDGAAGQKQPHLRAYWEILRPHNVPASFGLVAAGALVASHSAAALLELKVCARVRLFGESARFWIDRSICTGTSAFNYKRVGPVRTSHN